MHFVREYISNTGTLLISKVNGLSQTLKYRRNFHCKNIFVVGGILLFINVKI